MAKTRKSGLHKEISTIFDGIPLPDNEGQIKTAKVSPHDSIGGHIPPAPKKMPSNIETSTSKHDKVIELAVESQATPQAKPQPKPQPTPQAKPQKIKVASPPKKSSDSSLGKFFGQITAKLFAPKPGVNPVKQKMMVLLMPILIVAAVFVFGKNFIGIGGKNNNTAVKDNIFTPATASAKKEINWQKPAPYPETLRDPMQEYTVAMTDDNTSVKDNIVIKGIVWSKDNPSAVIGSQILYVGEKVHGAIITKITKEGVEFERDGKTWDQKVSGY